MIPKTLRRGMFFSPLLAALAGCNTVVMNPSGDIAKQEAQLIIVSVILMLLIIVPVMFLIFWFAYKYRASNTEAAYVFNSKMPFDAILEYILEDFGIAKAEATQAQRLFALNSFDGRAS